MGSMSLGGANGNFNPAGGFFNHHQHTFGGSPDSPRSTREFPAPPREAAEKKDTVRLPNDPEPFDQRQHLSNEDAVNFPSIFLPDENDTSITKSELSHVWERLNALIQKALDTNSTPKDTVKMVSEFYEANVRAHFSDAPVWLDRDIYNYIYGDSARQADAALDAVNKTVEFLRNNLAEKGKDEKIQPNENNIKLLLAAVKTHSFLVDAKRKRDREKL